MAFFSSRPHFENRQIVQWMGESIHLSGQTNFELGGFNSYIYNTYEDFLNGISGGTGYLNLIATSGDTEDPISGYTNHTIYSPGVFRIIPPKKIFFSGNTNVITGITQEDVTGYIPVAFDSQGTVVWSPLSGITSASGNCSNYYVSTIYPCSSGGTVTIEGNLTVKGVTTSGVTIIETEIVRVEDNNMELNWGGNHTTAIGGGITVLSGQSNSANSSIYTLSDGTWMFEPGLSSTTIPYIYTSDPTSTDSIITQTGNNSIDGSNNSSILGGSGNTISTTDDSTIAGGWSNTIDGGGEENFIGGGQNNKISGSRNFIGGGGNHTVSNFVNTVVGGWLNSGTTNNYLFLGGGRENHVRGEYSVIAGGYQNQTSQRNSVVGGGQNNVNYGQWSTIAGGEDNYIRSTEYNTFIGGGWRNSSSGSTDNTLVGGARNKIGINTRGVFIGGGGSQVGAGDYYNEVYSSWGTLVGGKSNRIWTSSDASFIGSGENNEISTSTHSSINGGFDNTITNSNYSSIGGGQENTIINSSTHSTILGGGDLGNGNTIDGSPWSGIIGGFTNTIRGQYGSVIAGTVGSEIINARNSYIIGGTGHNLTGATNGSGILGGTLNTIEAGIQNYGSSIVGGRLNVLQDGNQYSVILGGIENVSSDTYRSNIIGGENNKLSGYTYDSSILAGSFNLINLSDSSTIVGGYNHFIDGSNYSSIIGGRYNTISGHTDSVIIGGSGNTIDFDIYQGGNRAEVIIASDDSLITAGDRVLIGASSGSSITNTGESVILGSRNSSIYNGISSGILGGIDNTINGLDTNESQAIIGGTSNLLYGVTDRSVIIGGQGITGTSTDTVYVPYLNISNAPGGTAIAGLSIDSSGNVITGTSLNVGGVGELCYLCNYVFTGDTGTTITVTEGITDVFTEEPTHGTVTVDCFRCCTEWAYKYVDTTTQPPTPVYLTTTSFGDIKTVLGNEKFSSVKYKCISSNSYGTKETGVEYTVDVASETIPETTSEPTPIGGVNYTGFEATNTENIYIRDVYNVKITDSARVSVQQSTLVGLSGTSHSTVENSFNTMTYKSNGAKIGSTHDSIIKESNWAVMYSSKESTLDGDYTSIISSNNAETQNTEGTAVIASKDIVATQNYTLYTSGLYVDDVNGLNTTSLKVKTPIDQPLDTCSFVVTTGGTVGVKTCNPTFDLEVNGSFGATSKSFVIPHPLKEGKKLVHGAIEGPEFGVYDRGRFFDGIIELPDYWVKLVDESTITVQLTGEGFFMSPYVKEIKDNKVFVGNRFPFLKPTGFYTVYGERKDIDKINLEIDA